MRLPSAPQTFRATQRIVALPLGNTRKLPLKYSAPQNLRLYTTAEEEKSLPPYFTHTKYILAVITGITFFEGYRLTFGSKSEENGEFSQLKV